MASTSWSKTQFCHIPNPETNCSGNAYSLPSDQNVRAEKRNAQKRKACASMDIQRKLSLLDNKRVKYRHQVGNTGEALPSTSYQRTFPQQKRPRRTSLPKHRLRTRLANISSHAWSLPFGRCRTYNNTTTFSSFGIRYDETLVKSNKGIYTLRIQGAVYNFIRDLLPAEGHGRQLQLYFYEPEHELQNRLSQSGYLDVQILEDIIDLMRINPYAMFFRGLRELVNLEEYNIVLRADPSLDKRIYNLPTVNQVAAIWNEMTDVPALQPHDIRVYASSGKTHCIHYYYGCYDPLQYLLLFPYGESGWHTGIHRVSLVSAATDARSVNNAAVRRLFFLAVTFLENLFMMPSSKI
ncbi:hypothetical protein OROMI_012517 [Orobanche minor]